MKKKCVITFYNPNAVSPPYDRIFLDDVILEEYENDHLGENFAITLRSTCYRRGYNFKCYCMCGEDFSDYDYEIVVEMPNNLPDKISRKLKLNKINKNIQMRF